MRDMTGRARVSSDLRQALRLGAPRRLDGSAQLLHAGLDCPSSTCRYGLFGSREAARASGAEHVVSAFLDIRSPLEAPEGCVDLEDALSRLGLKSIEDLPGFLALSGHDGLYIRSAGPREEDQWWPCDPAQIQTVSQARTDLCRNPWEFDRSAWIGPAIVADIFEIEGRSEEFEHLWDALEEEGEDLGVLARLADGWEVRWINDWEPEGTVGLFDPAGHPKGFYMGSMAWIDEDARGKGLSAHMILAVAELLGAPPARNLEGLGYSEAGHAAHVAAHEMALSRDPGTRPEADDDICVTPMP